MYRFWNQTDIDNKEINSGAWKRVREIERESESSFEYLLIERRSWRRRELERVR